MIVQAIIIQIVAITQAIVQTAIVTQIAIVRIIVQTITIARIIDQIIVQTTITVITTIITIIITTTIIHNHQLMKTIQLILQTVTNQVVKKAQMWKFQNLKQNQKTILVME